MAQTIIGLDIGSFSVKVSTVSASFRSFNWVGYREFEIPHDRRARPERAAAQVLGELGRQVGTSSVVICALPGDRVMTRFIELPFSDPKRIDSVLGFELEGQIPLGVEEMLYSYQPVGQAESGDTEIFAAAVKHEYMERYLGDLQEAGIDPRVITLDTTSYVNLYDHLVGEGTVVFVDIGHRTTKICIVEDGRLRLARSIGRGGAAVTEAIAAHFEIPFEEAEQLKHERAQLPIGEESDELSAMVAQEMQPIAMAIRQSCQSYTRDSGKAVGQVLVTGGGSRLRNCLPWLQPRVAAQTRRLALETLEFNKVADSEGAWSAAKSIGLALQQAAASTHIANINFRRAEYAYEGDYKYLRDKLTYLAVLAAVLVVVGVAYGIVKNNSMQRTLDKQYQSLAEFTQTHLGQRESSFKQTLAKLTRPRTADEEVELFPPMTAIAVLDKITAIQQEMNRPQLRAGGPLPRPPPRPQAMPNVREALDRQRQGRGVSPRAAGPRGLQTADPRRGLPRARPGSPQARRGSPDPGPAGTAGPRVRPGARPGARPGEAPPGRDGPRVDAATDPTDGDGSAADPEDPTDTRGSRAEHQKIELSIVDIDVLGEVRLTAETHESNVKGAEQLRLRLAAELCFTQVKRREIGAVVSTGRHSDWVKFEVTFRVKCPTAGEEAAPPAGGGGR